MMKSLKKFDFRTAAPYVALLAVALLMVLPLFRIGFNSTDDFQYYNTARQSWDYWAWDHYYYAITGRFYFLVTKYFYYVPYLCGNFVVTKLIQYSTLMAAYMLFSHLVGRVARSRRASVLTLLLLLLNTVALPPRYVVAVVCYPFYFTFSLVIFLTGCLLYVNHWQRNATGSVWRPWAGGALIFVSFLFYENYLLFTLMLGLYVLARHWDRGRPRPPKNQDCDRPRSPHWERGRPRPPKKQDCDHPRPPRMLLHETLPLLLAATVYLALWFGYRVYLQRSGIGDLYGGTSFNPDTFSLAQYWKIIARWTVAAFPCSPYFQNLDLIAESCTLPGGHRNSLLFIMVHAPVAAWTAALLVAALAWRLTRRRVTLSWKFLAGAALAGLAVAFLSHTLIAVAEKYNEGGLWFRGYVTTLFSYFGVALVLMAAVMASIKAVGPSIPRAVIRALWCIVLFLFTLVNGYSNEHISRALERNRHCVDMLEHVAGSGFFDTLPEGSIVYTDAFHHASELFYGISSENDDVEDLIQGLTRQRLLCTWKAAVVKDTLAARPDAPVYLLNAVEARKAGDLLMTVARADSFDPDRPEEARASHADLFYLSPEKHYTVVYSSLSGIHTVSVDAPENEPVTRSTIDDEGLDPWGILISNMKPHGHYNWPQHN